jgi:hypothetical protein
MKQRLNKSLATNIISVVISVIGIIFSVPLIKSVGFFALSGAITNWLAIYMLFEKVPFLYGSGVIPERFEDFKLVHQAINDGTVFYRKKHRTVHRERGTARRQVAEPGTLIEGRRL